MLPTMKHPEMSADGLCQTCHKNKAEFVRYKINQNVCDYCWTRLEHPALAEKTDDELIAMKAEAVKQIHTERKVRGIVNADNFIGFRPSYKDESQT